jgi:hypothetical protein
MRRAPRAARACLLVVLTLSAFCLWAQSRPRVVLDTLVGFNGVARAGASAPLLVSVTTPGARLDAEVRVQVAWGSTLRGTQETRTLARTETFAAGGTRRVPFVIPFPADARTLSVSVVAGAVTLASTTVDLRPAVTEDRVVAAVSSTLSLDAIAGLSSGASTVRVTYPRVDDLPDSWAGYDGVDMVVVHDTYFRALRDTQAAALVRWVTAGGSVVFTGGAGALQHASAGLASLLPVEVLGLEELSSFPGLAALAPGAPALRGRASVARAAVRAGSVLASQDDLPLVVRRPLGRGAAWFLAFDPALPPFAEWPGMVALWKLMDAGALDPSPGAGTTAPAEDPWMAVLLSRPPLAFPSLLVVLLFCTAYLVVLGVAVLVRPRWWPLLVAAPILAGAAAWILFDSVLFHAAPLVLDASVSRVRSGDGTAMVTERVGLFASRPTSAGIAFAPADLLLEERAAFPASARRARQEASVIETSSVRGPVVRAAPLGRFGSRLIVATGIVPLPVSYTIAGGAGTERVTVVNDSADTLHGAFYLRRGRAWRLGDIDPGATVSRVLAEDDALDMHALEAVAAVTGGGQRAAFWIEASPVTAAEAGVVAAWLDHPALRFEAPLARRDAPRPSLALLVVEAS